jgi:hypothetical protein
MNNVNLIELSAESIFNRIEKHETWKLLDITLFVFGYEYEGFDWDFSLDNNFFPVRQYHTALESINHPDSKKRLAFVKKIVAPNGFEIHYVKRRTFFDWAEKEWKTETKRVMTEWKKYKAKKNKTASPASSKLRARVSDHMNDLQIRDFREHCKAKPSETFYANMAKLSQEAAKKFENLAPKSIARYSKRMTHQELMAALPAKGENKA